MASDFKFQPRCGTVDWRRISGVDVDHVIRHVDVATLQENIAGITFCNFDREACRRCGHPVDPALLKVLRLAQLIIEYMQYSQEYLSTNITKLEAQLQVCVGQQECSQKELDRKTDELKGMREECRRCQKLINTLQQMLLQTGTQDYPMCHLCDKMFMNSRFLWKHIYRRHGNMAETGKQKMQGHPLEEQLEELMSKMKLIQGELEAYKEAEKQQQCQEAEFARQREKEARDREVQEREIRKEFDGWLEKERVNLHMEIDKLKKLFWDEFKNIVHRITTLEQGLQSHSMRASNLGPLQDEDSAEHRELAQILQYLTDRMKSQEMEWARKMKELQEKYADQKRELQEEKQRIYEEKERVQKEKERLYEERERLMDILTQDKRTGNAEFRHQMEVLHAKLKEQTKVILSQEKKMQTAFLRKIEAIEPSRRAVHTQTDSSDKAIHQGRRAVSTQTDSSEKAIRQGRRAVSTQTDSSEKAIRQGRRAVSTQTDSSEKVIRQGRRAVSTQTDSSEKAIRQARRAVHTQTDSSEKAIRQARRAVHTQTDSSDKDLEDSQDENLPAAVRQKRILVKHFRLILEETLQEELEKVGIKKTAKGIKTATLENLTSLFKAQREMKAANFPEILSVRKKLVKEIARRMKEREGTAESQQDSSSPAKRQQKSVSFQEPLPTFRTQYAVSPSKPAGPHKATPQSLGSHGPGLAPVPSSTEYRKAQKYSNSAAAPEDGMSSTPPFSSGEDFGGESRQHVSPHPWKVSRRRRPHREDDFESSESGSSEGTPQAPGKGTAKRQQKSVSFQEPLPTAKTQLAASPTEPAGPHKATPQSLGSHGPGLAPVPSSTEYRKAQKYSNSAAAPEDGMSSTPPFSSGEDFGGESRQHVSPQPRKVSRRRRPHREDDFESSESGSSEGTPQAPGKGTETPVQSMAKSLEKQPEAPVKKSAGGSEDESDLEISFVEDAPQNLDESKKPKKPLSRSKFAEKFGTTAWSPGHPRVSA